MTDTVQRAKEALWGRYHELNPHIFVDSKGYVNNSKENLLQPEWMEFIKADYEKKGLGVKSLFLTLRLYANLDKGF